MPCDFCGNEGKIAGTIFVGRYCIECHKANIMASREAIEYIKTGILPIQEMDEVAFQEAFGDVATKARQYDKAKGIAELADEA